MVYSSATGTCFSHNIDLPVYEDEGAGVQEQNIISWLLVQSQDLIFKFSETDVVRAWLKH